MMFPNFSFQATPCTRPTIHNPDLAVSRVVVYTHSSLRAKVRPDLIDSSVSAVWLEVGLPNRKKILVCNIYREWGYLRQQDKSSHTIAAQLSRWQTFLTFWERVLTEDKEVIVTGDVNIDCFMWCRDDLTSTDSTYKLKLLIELLFEKIIPHGVSQPGVHKTGIRGIQDTRQIVDGKTNDIENNNKKGGSKPLT